MSVFVCVNVCHICECLHRPKRTLDGLELELKVVVRYLTCVLEVKLGYSETRKYS